MPKDPFGLALRNQAEEYAYVGLSINVTLQLSEPEVELAVLVMILFGEKAEQLVSKLMTKEGAEHAVVKPHWDALQTLQSNYVDRILAEKQYKRLRDFFVKLLEMDPSSLPEPRPDKIHL